MKISIVVPVYNEQDSVEPLFNKISEAFADIERYEWEVLFVDDGSQDESLAHLEHLAEQHSSKIGVVVLRRNYGQTAAIAAGIDHSAGDVIVLLDADMQNDPADIPLMLEKIDEGYDVVSGWRYNRKDAFLTRTLPSRIANWIISTITGIHLHDFGCTLKAYRREVITGFRLYGEMHRFIPVYANSMGAKIVEVRVKHHQRKYGKAKYGLERTFKVLLDLFTVKFLTTYASKPIYIFGGAGALLIAISAVVLLYLFIRRVWFQVAVTTSPLFLLSSIAGLLGVQSILMGLIAELLARTYHESQNKPTYTTKKVIGVSK